MSKVNALVCSGCLNEYHRLSGSHNRDVFLTDQQTRRPRSRCLLIHFPCEDSLPGLYSRKPPSYGVPNSREKERKKGKKERRKTLKQKGKGKKKGMIFCCFSCSFQYEKMSQPHSNPKVYFFLI